MSVLGERGERLATTDTFSSQNNHWLSASLSNNFGECSPWSVREPSSNGEQGQFSKPRARCVLATHLPAPPPHEQHTSHLSLKEQSGFTPCLNQILWCIYSAGTSLYIGQSSQPRQPFACPASLVEGKGGGTAAPFSKFLLQEDICNCTDLEISG